MKSLYGKTYEQFAEIMGERPEKHLHQYGDERTYSVFLDQNEFLFDADKLNSIEIGNFTAVSKIPGFTFPIWKRLETLLVLLNEAQLDWEIFCRYSNQKWIVIRLQEDWILYEFEFDGKRFALEKIRLEAPRSATP